MSKRTLVLPIPPLILGVSWTGKTLTKYCLDNLDSEGKKALLGYYEEVGPDVFKRVFAKQAEDLNARFAARGHEGKNGGEQIIANTLKVN